MQILLFLTRLLTLNPTHPVSCFYDTPNGKVKQKVKAGFICGLLALKSIKYSKKIRLFRAGYRFHRWTILDPMKLVSCLYDTSNSFKLRQTTRPGSLDLKINKKIRKTPFVLSRHTFHIWRMPDPMELVSCLSDNFFPFHLRKRHDFWAPRTWLNIFFDKSHLLRLTFSRRVRWCWCRCLKTFRSVSNHSRRASSGSKGRRDKRETDSWSAHRDERTDMSFISERPPGAKP